MRSAAAALSLVLLLSACPAETPPGASPFESVTPPSEPVSGGTLAVAVRDLKTFDPVRATNPLTEAGVGTLSALSHVFEPLTRIDPVTNRVVPGAAARWDVLERGLVWRFVLAKRTFHNGRPVRAGDFKFAFDRIARAKNNSDASYQLEQVVGFEAVRFPPVRARQLAGVQAPRPNVLRITLQRPFAELAYNLAHPALGPLPRAVYQRSLKGLARSPVGNGPFRVQSATRSGAVLQPHAGYRGSKPFVDAIEYRVVRTVEAGWRLYRAGEVHVADVPPAAVDPAGSLYREEGFTPFWATLTFGFNLRRGIFGSREVRRAISLAIDRQAIATTIYGNTRDPGTGLVPRGVRGFDEDVCSVCSADRARAQRLLDAAFGDDKPAFAIVYFDEASSRQVARALEADLEAVGLKITLRAFKSRKRYLTTLDRREFGLAQLGWLSEVPSPDPFLAQQLRTNHRNNHTGFANPAFDRAIDRARRTLAEGTRLRVYRNAERIALDRMPQIPIVFYRNRTAVADNVQDFFLNGAGLFSGSRVWLAP